MMLNSQLSIPESQTASSIGQRRSFLGRKIGLRPLLDVKKNELVRPQSSLNLTGEKGVVGARIHEIYRAKPRQGEDKVKDTTNDSMDVAASGEATLIKSRCESSLYSSSNYSFTCSLYIHKALQHKLLDCSVSKSYDFDEADLKSKARWSWTERMRWDRRPSHANSPLVILNFEGVLGDYFEESFWTKRPACLYLRPGWLKGLRLLTKRMQLVLVASCSQGKLRKLLEILNERKVKFDAVYRRHSHKQERHLLNYSQILHEFHVKKPVSDRTLVLSSIALEDAEIEKRFGQDLVYEPSMSLDKRWTCMNTPSSHNASLRPAFCLVPNPRVQPGFSSMTFDTICNFVNELYMISSNFSLFSFKAAMATSDPAAFYSIKRVLLPDYATSKTNAVHEHSSFAPITVPSSIPDCLVFSASRCIKKPYIKIEEDLMNEEPRKLMNFRLA